MLQCRYIMFGSAVHIRDRVLKVRHAANNTSNGSANGPGTHAASSRFRSVTAQTFSSHAEHVHDGPRSQS